MLVVAFLVMALRHVVVLEGTAGFGEALGAVASGYVGPVVLVLIVIETLRQVHILTAERSATYRRRRDARLARLDRWAHTSLDDRSRHLLATTAKSLFWLVVAALILAEIVGAPPLNALLRAPDLLGELIAYAPQLALGVLFVGIIAGALLWRFLRAGIDTCLPGEIATRLSDIWGQDHIVDRLRDHVVLLRDPTPFEARGGHVSRGLLLSGPPGTGKTLMAESLAGESAKPYVHVRPDAFTGPLPALRALKMKTLFRRLRRLALRHNGVIVHFPNAETWSSPPRSPHPTPHGNARLSSRTPPSDAMPTNGTTAPTRAMTENGSASPERWLENGPFPPSKPILDAPLAPPNAPSPASGTAASVSAATPRNAHAGVLPASDDHLSATGRPPALMSLLAELSGLTRPHGFFNVHVRRLLGMRPLPPPKHRILVVLSSDSPKSLDDSLVRPGLIDRVYEVAFPSKAGRLRIYQAHFAQVRHQLTPDQLDTLAATTPGFTGPAIRTLVNESLITALRAEREHITWPDIMTAHRLTLSNATKAPQPLTPTQSEPGPAAVNGAPTRTGTRSGTGPGMGIGIRPEAETAPRNGMPNGTGIDTGTWTGTEAGSGVGDTNGTAPLSGRRARYGYGAAPGRRRFIGPVGMVVAAVIGLVVFVLIGVALFGGDQISADGGGSTGLSLRAVAAMLAGLVVLGAGAVVAVMAVRAQQAARARAEENRARAVERTQLLAAALDPETAMRLLGYPSEQPASPTPLHTTTGQPLDFKV
ncbi:AAA family ATPase [Sphaerisporangium siamense]|uniref:SpoVK/Ycf46/Vps4 family AAA+-type ATPase n=1 Tax=Sphaerisporangium siamense TaxID=795645 RepID=A0A7W7DA01_9ACTN|nr:AAA family ATPase [Sphaerisporangium siamense]MBB4703005.1 SpoVK/Ycf46/Vps4 family AAA+-type ATPase [Sphaerisporangium siamense]